MQLVARVAAGDQLEEGEKLAVAVAVTLASNSGSVENLNVSTQWGARSWSAQTRATVMRLTPRWSARVRVDQ
jgi:hypothetical protein